MSDPERVGARGGGFVIDRGVHTEVEVEDSDEYLLEVYINRIQAPDAETTRAVATALLRHAACSCRVLVRHRISVPIGAGFGSSAAGALSTVLALSRALGVNLTMLQAGRIAHVAEVRCGTGLGTVGPITLGGCVVTIEPGAPGYAVIDRIATSNEHRIVTGFYRPISTREMLLRAKTREKVNSCGRETVDRILADPSLESFMQASKRFAAEAGFTTPVTQRLIDLAEKAGAIGAAQNMVGEAVHALTTADDAQRIVEAFKKVLPSKNVLTARVDTRGARLSG